MLGMVWFLAGELNQVIRDPSHTGLGYSRSIRLKQLVGLLQKHIVFQLHQSISPQQTPLGTVVTIDDE
jgi:hypothetical protein